MRPLIFFKQIKSWQRHNSEERTTITHSNAPKPSSNNAASIKIGPKKKKKEKKMAAFGAWWVHHFLEHLGL